MSTEIELRKQRCCFTGHRPEKPTMLEYEIEAAVEKAIHTPNGFSAFSVMCELLI